MTGTGRGIGDYGARFGIGPAVFTLLIINGGVFVLQYLLQAAGGRDYVFELGAYATSHAVYKLQFWRFFSYMFLHGGIGHLFFNMLGLWLFGSRLEAIWGSRTFTWYYLTCGVGGSVLTAGITLIGLQGDAPMVGASGAVFGILLAFGLAFPDAVIFVFFIPMKARIAVVVFGLMALLGVGGTHIAHMAHLGGMVTGFLFLWLFTAGHPSQPPRLPGGKRGRGAFRSVSSTGYSQTGGQGRSISLGEYLRRSFHRWRTRMRLTVVDSRRRGQGDGQPDNGSTGGRKATRVDEILEKISKEGLQSLTPEEQDILRRASRKQ